MTPVQLVGQGEDAFGKFTIAMRGRCDVCWARLWPDAVNAAKDLTLDQARQQSMTDAVVRYTRVKFPEGITVRATILWPTGAKKRVSHIGVTCGCYGKLHRQVAHIEDTKAATAANMKGDA